MELKNRLQKIYDELVDVNQEIYNKYNIIIKHYESLKDEISKKYFTDKILFMRVFEEQFFKTIGIYDNVFHNMCRYVTIIETNEYGVDGISIQREKARNGVTFRLGFGGRRYEQMAELELYIPGVHSSLEDVIEKCEKIDINMVINWIEDYEKQQENKNQKQFERKKQAEIKLYKKLEHKYGKGRVKYEE